MTYETIIVETKARVGIIRLNRPEAYNALNAKLKFEVGEALGVFEANESIGCIIITGSEKVFAAGADVKELIDKPPHTWSRVAETKKPVIAAVAGYVLGGGCELAMQCDFIIAADTAKFGQPEIKIGLIPGCGGTQRLAQAVGKSKTMDMILTGRMIDANDAEKMGLVSRTVPAASLMKEAMSAAETIASMSLPAALAAKQAVNGAFEKSLHNGLRLELELYSALFSTDDYKEGMQAFIEKRTPRWKNR